jgi:hypothetical protein
MDCSAYSNNKLPRFNDKTHEFRQQKCNIYRDVYGSITRKSNFALSLCVFLKAKKVLILQLG